MGNNHSNNDGGKGNNNGKNTTGGLQFTTTSASSPSHSTVNGGGNGPMTVEQRLIAANKGMTRTESGANLQEQRFGNQLQPIEKLAKVGRVNDAVDFVLQRLFSLFLFAATCKTN